VDYKDDDSRKQTAGMLNKFLCWRAKKNAGFLSAAGNPYVNFIAR